MTFNNSKMQIHLVAKQGTYDDKNNLADTNYLITCCLLYETIASIIRADSSYDGLVSLLAKKYLKSYISIVEGLKQKYVSYSVMMSYIKDWEYPKFYEISEEQANKIISLYHDKTEIEQFSVNTYSYKMYNIEKLSDIQNERLRNIHYKIMVPIMQYCIDEYGANTHDIEVFSINDVETNPGKVILFKVNNVQNAGLTNDIKNKIGVNKYIYSVNQYGEYIKLIIN